MACVHVPMLTYRDRDESVPPEAAPGGADRLVPRPSQVQFRGRPVHQNAYGVFVSRNRGLRLVASTGAAVVVFCPSAAADPGSPSYQQGKQSIDDAVHQYHVQLTPSTDLHDYYETLLRSDLKSGQIATVDVPSDYVAGCQDEARVKLIPGTPNDASTGGVDDQHVGLGPAGDFGWD
jgi:hypothetical protein